MLTLNPIRPGLFSRSPGLVGSEETIYTVFQIKFPYVNRQPYQARPFQLFPRPWGFRGQDAKNQGYHQLIEMKLGISRYSHDNMSDAKFESGSFPSFGHIAPQNFLLKRETSHKIRIFIPGKCI